MKKALYWLIATTFLVVYSKPANAQVGVTYGPEIGFTASGLYDEYENVEAGLHLHIGGTAHIQIGGYFAVRPSLIFKTGSFKDAELLEDEYKRSLTRIAVPIPLLFSKEFENEAKFYIGAGPNFMYSLGGKEVEGSISRKLMFGNDPGNDLKRLDLGLHFKTGFQWSNGLTMNLFFNGGMTNINPNSTYNDYKLKSMDALCFSVGWMFGGNRDY